MSRDRAKDKLTAEQAAREVVDCLQAAGYVALFAGGCVRDMLRGAVPSDYDVATSAKPEEVTRLFRRTQQVGAAFGVVLVRVGRRVIEVATFRTDDDYLDGRRPTAVHFTDAKHDAERRDFTINGMFFDPVKGETIDYVGGKADLAAGIVRAIGNPQRRFAEDHLRILRAVRFASRLGFGIEPATKAAITQAAPLLPKISPERIREELAMILTNANRAAAFGLLREMGVFVHLWPQAAEMLDRADYLQNCLAHLPEDASFELVMAALLHVASSNRVAEVCDVLRCSNQTSRVVSWLVSHQGDLECSGNASDADIKLLMAHEAFDELMQLWRARLAASGDDEEPWRKLQRRCAAYPSDEVAPPPLLNGDHLSAMGMTPGPHYKHILDRVYRAQLNGEIATFEEAKVLATRLAPGDVSE